jgi:dihydroxyacetone kinase-like protein
MDNKSDKTIHSFTNDEGVVIVRDLVDAVYSNRQYLSDIDGEIGDGDHGINMNKGFRLCGEELDAKSCTLSEAFLRLSTILMTKIGGAMGPLYGTFFRSLGKTVAEKECVDAECFEKMLSSAVESIRKISDAHIGDKTLLDVLIPAEQAYSTARAEGKSFQESLQVMSVTAGKGRDATKDMVAKVGRSSRLGKRSKGVIDAGAASSCLILQTMANSIIQLLEREANGVST